MGLSIDITIKSRRYHNGQSIGAYNGVFFPKKLTVFSFHTLQHQN